MKEKSRWDPPGWPWELELLALVFVIAAIMVPFYLDYASTPQSSEDLSLIEQAEKARQDEAVAVWNSGADFFWAIAIVCLYVAHMVMAGASLNYLSTSFSHLLAPLMFAAITYYRLLMLNKQTGAGTAIVKGSVLEIFMWILGVVVITFLVARIRMARHMLNFRDVDWDLSTPTKMDSSFGHVAIRIQPLIYPPRVYRVCDQGILIEGWLYLLPISFSLVQSIDRIRQASFLGPGTYLATSGKSLIRIHLTESPDPILISPQDAKPFLRYCKQHVQAMRPGTRAVETVTDFDED